MNNRIGLLSWLKTNIIESNLPYAKHLNFKRNEFDFGDKQKDGLNNMKVKKRPDQFEKNIDINDVNVDIYANQIAKYGRGYTKEEANKDDNRFFKKKNQNQEDISDHGGDITKVNTRTKFNQQQEHIFIPGSHFHDGIPSTTSYPGVTRLTVYREFCLLFLANILYDSPLQLSYTYL
jgi:hypothetical protein